MSKETKKITLGLILSWIFGVLFGISGLTFLFSGGIVAGGSLILASLVLLPPVNKFVKEKYNFELSRGLKITLVIILFVIYAVSLPSSNMFNDDVKVQPTENLNQPSETSTPSNTQTTTPTETTATTQTTTPAVEEQTDTTTMGEKNALSKAKTYLRTMPFSYSGLIDQLEFEGYSYQEAKYGADNCGADWNEQAALKAQVYLDTMPFSRQGLIDQLEFEGFTQSQAEYGADAVGY